LPSSYLEQPAENKAFTFETKIKPQPEVLSASNTVDVMVASCYLMSVHKPTYSLAQMKGLIRDGSWIVRESALDSALEMGFDDEDISDCIVNYLEETHFYKTMPAEKNPALMQDVYHITYHGHRIYVKVQINVLAVVISFKAL
jgi:hypothetical protein